jgi:multimeric flavodoxin WrbA
MDDSSLVIGILGSPRARSQTRPLLERLLAGAQAGGAQTQLFALREMSYISCRHCGGCSRTGRCAVKDDAEAVHQRIRAARHLAIASPIHFAGVSGEMKMWIDRAQCCWVATYRLRQAVSPVQGERRGVFLATCGGADTRVFEYAKPTLRAFFNSTGFRYWGELFEAGTDDPPPVSERAEVLARAEELGRALVES